MAAAAIAAVGSAVAAAAVIVAAIAVAAVPAAVVVAARNAAGPGTGWDNGQGFPGAGCAVAARNDSCAADGE